MNRLAETWWPAPAKLNLFLHVTGRRADGYHELDTLFQLVDWSDELAFAVDDSGRVRRQAVDYDVAEDDDLAVRAARLLQQHAGVDRGAEIRVRKHIPMGAGLGGGSTDAATTLLVLNRLWGVGFSVAKLAELALELGADVPVFVRGHSAMAEGVGERLQPVQLGIRHYVVVVPDVRVATRWAFAAPDLKRSAPRLDRTRALSGHGENVFEPVVAAHFPEVAEALDALREWGEPKLSGTGSAVFVPVPDQELANRAARELKCRYNVRAVRGVDRSSVHQMLESE
ncbi:4-(cytidine 5'-diphospho)-2-C-methyl-D-erythritol kinase [Elongatibacter sediminis]|uniref:4-diphosphocytidyl-2-C-methyl-D-erythritol kinase n=1 Tax=Elongatibacter sediminis TaxID=3119006 RepID=A0AAW9R843_9GAMM